MNHKIMTVKLCELDERIARLHSRVRLTETADRDILEREIYILAVSYTHLDVYKRQGYDRHFRVPQRYGIYLLEAV